MRQTSVTREVVAIYYAAISKAKSRLTSKHHDGVLWVASDANLAIRNAELTGDSRNVLWQLPQGRWLF